jgi:carbonic anhydrase
MPMHAFATRTLLAVCLLLATRLLHAQEAQPSPEEALKLLKEGNARFVADMKKSKSIDEMKWLEIAQKQQPFAIVLSCADSRTVPALIFDKGLGEVFTLSVAGNVSGPEVLASMEYGVAKLKTPLIVVIGHTNCGAVQTAVDGKELPSANLKHLIDLIHTGPLPKDARDKEAVLNGAIRANVLHQTKLLTRDSSILKEFTEAKRIQIVPALLSLKTGAVEWLELPKEGAK